MALSNLTIGLILVGALALEFTYLAVRRWFFLSQESTDAAKWYSRQRGWSTRASDVSLTTTYLQHSQRWITGAAFVCWVLFLALLVARSA